MVVMPVRTQSTFTRLSQLVAVVVACALLGSGFPAPARAQAPTPPGPTRPGAPPLRIQVMPATPAGEDGEGARITARADKAGVASNPGTLPNPRILAFELRRQRIRSQADLDAVTTRIDHLVTQPWQGSAPPTGEGNEDADPAGIAHADLPPAAQMSSAPSAPVTILRRGWVRGAPILVVAVWSVFDHNGQAVLVNELEATIPDATPLTSDRAGFAASMLGVDSFTPQAPAAPINPAANAPAIKIAVSQPGIQRVTGAALAAAGLNISATDPALLHLRLNGQPIALETRGAGDGRLDPGNEIRFYAPSAGDRWNTTTLYWLTVEATAGARMPARDATGGAGPTQNTAIERRVWRNNKLYDSLVPGPNGDHWFAHRLLTGPGSPSAVVTVPITTSLPKWSVRSFLPLAQVNAAGSMAIAPAVTEGATSTSEAATPRISLTVAGSAQTSGQHHLSVRLGASAISARWSGAGDWQHTFTFTGAIDGDWATLTLVSGAMPDSVSIASIEYEASVMLSFAGRGGAFSGGAGVARYQLRGTPAGRVLYDVTLPQTPTIVHIPAGTDTRFDHADSVHGSVARDYVLAGPGTLVAPQVMPHTPVDLVSPRNARLIYIGPASLHATLTPLIALRQAQGFSAIVVDTQAIYDTWSYGQVSPAAIRSFLQHAASAWPAAPRFVTLVGDGTADPHDYTARGALNVNLVPPYLAPVDPWIRETACDTCYGQLDGEEPLSDPFPDVPVGRLPVKSAGELAGVVSKIVNYETATVGPVLNSWRSRIGLLADNYREPDGAADAAGDFAAMADGVIALQPAALSPQRVYYDPYPPTQVTAAWRVGSALSAYTRTIELFNAGAGVINFYGHAHQFQIASTASFTNPNNSQPASYLLYLYDADQLNNADRLPIMIQMTCYTGAFQTPLAGGATLDERLALAPGGAIAVWGNTGKGVAYGNTYLQRGFYAALWNAPAMTARVGDLVLAGYLDLLTQSPCCQESVNTYVVLGDVATRARVFAPKQQYIPSVSKP